MDAIAWHLDADEDGLGAGVEVLVQLRSVMWPTQMIVTIPSGLNLDDADGDGFSTVVETRRWKCSWLSDFDQMDSAPVRTYNDFAPPIHPDAEELCDGLDNNCDETVDGDDAESLHLNVDGDGDGYGAEEFVLSCTQPEGHVPNNLDCDDGDGSSSR